MIVLDQYVLPDRSSRPGLETRCSCWLPVAAPLGFRTHVGTSHSATVILISARRPVRKTKRGAQTARETETPELRRDDDLVCRGARPVGRKARPPAPSRRASVITSTDGMLPARCLARTSPMRHTAPRRSSLRPRKNLSVVRSKQRRRRSRRGTSRQHLAQARTDRAFARAILASEDGSASDYREISAGADARRREGQGSLPVDRRVLHSRSTNRVADEHDAQREKNSGERSAAREAQVPATRRRAHTAEHIERKRELEPAIGVALERAVSCRRESPGVVCASA